MPRSTPSSPTSNRGLAPPARRVVAAALLHQRVRDARLSPDTFVEFCFTDGGGRPVRQAAVHRELQAFLSAHPRALVELPRDHGKTVQVCGRVLWELGREPALRVKVVCATDGLAADRGRFLRDAVAGNPRVRLVFPHLVPGRPWAADGFTVARRASTIGPSVAAFGVGAGATGARADLLVCDDVVDVRALHSRADRDRVSDCFLNNLFPLLEPTGRFWGLCTPWHADDLNSRLKRNPAFALFRRAVGPDLEPVWPEKWPAAALAARRDAVGAAAFARGYRLLPLDEGEVAVRPEWVRFWDDELPRERFAGVVLAVDPAVTAKATADASALVVLGRVDGGNDVRVLEAVGRRVAAPELIGLLDDCDRRWRPDVILFESNGAFAALRDLLVRQARFGPRVRGEAQSRSKSARVAALAVVVQSGVVRLKGAAGGVDPGQRELFGELTTFPFAPHDDLVDATAAGAEYLLGRPEPRVWV